MSSSTKTNPAVSASGQVGSSSGASSEQVAKAITSLPASTPSTKSISAKQANSPLAEVVSPLTQVRSSSGDSPGRAAATFNLVGIVAPSIEPEPEQVVPVPKVMTPVPKPDELTSALATAKKLFEKNKFDKALTVLHPFEQPAYFEDLNQIQPFEVQELDVDPPGTVDETTLEAWHLLTKIYGGHAPTIDYHDEKVCLYIAAGAKYHHKPALRNLAKCLLESKHVDRDFDKAIQIYEYLEKQDVDLQGYGSVYARCYAADVLIHEGKLLDALNYLIFGANNNQPDPLCCLGYYLLIGKLSEFKEEVKTQSIRSNWSTLTEEESDKAWSTLRQGEKCLILAEQQGSLMAKIHLADLYACWEPSKFITLDGMIYTCASHIDENGYAIKENIETAKAYARSALTDANKKGDYQIVDLANTILMEIEQKLGQVSEPEPEPEQVSEPEPAAEVESTE